MFSFEDEEEYDNALTFYLLEKTDKPTEMYNWKIRSKDVFDFNDIGEIISDLIPFTNKGKLVDFDGDDKKRESLYEIMKYFDDENFVAFINITPLTKSL